jgi:hypothetical protein
MIMSTVRQLETPGLNLYEQDFFAWTMAQAAALRHNRPEGVDWENAAEELESMGKRDRRELESRLRGLLMHLMKWVWQPEKRGASWEATIVEQRKEILKIFIQSPSLKGHAEQVLTEEWRDARRLASIETGLPLSEFLDACPWDTNRQVLADWWPE